MSTSPIIGTTQLVDSQANKTVTINQMVQDLEAAAVGYGSVSVAGTGAFALTQAQARYGIIELTGALTGSRTITIPAGMTNRVIFINSTTGAYVLSVQYGAGGTVAIPSGGAVEVYYNGGNAAYLNTRGVEVSAYRSSSQSLSASTDTRVSLNTKTFDVSGSFDATTNFLFTAPVAGTYQVCGAVVVSITVAGTGDAGIECFLRVNGTSAARGTYHQGPTSAVGRARSHVAAVLRLNAGDTVDLAVRHTQAGATANVNAGADSTYLQVLCQRVG